MPAHEEVVVIPEGSGPPVGDGLEAGLEPGWKAAPMLPDSTPPTLGGASV